MCLLDCFEYMYIVFDIKNGNQECGRFDDNEIENMIFIILVCTM